MSNKHRTISILHKSKPERIEATIRSFLTSLSPPNCRSRSRRPNRMDRLHHAYDMSYGKWSLIYLSLTYVYNNSFHIKKCYPMRCTAKVAAQPRINKDGPNIKVVRINMTKHAKPRRIISDRDSWSLSYEIMKTVYNLQLKLLGNALGDHHVLRIIDNACNALCTCKAW